LVTKMFPVGSVASLSANQESQFGLQSWVNKRLVVCGDLPEHMRKVLSQTIWQSMLSGEYVTVPRKNLSALSVAAWEVPLFWCGNNLPDYRDNAGSVSRRLATFKFEQVVQNRDTSMAGKIERDELLDVLLRCLKKYHALRTKYPGGDFWKFAPRALLDSRNEAQEETNYLANFVANGDDYYDCVFQEGAQTTLIVLKKAFQNHMRINHDGVSVKWSGDYHALRARGFIVEKDNVCKFTGCAGPPRKAVCGDHFCGGKNRKKLTVVRNLVVTTRTMTVGCSRNGPTTRQIDAHLGV
jgi:hypothetical protein